MSREGKSTQKRQCKITGPVEGGIHGWPFAGYFGNIGKYDYVEEEYFIEGDAVHYTEVGELTLDGKWELKEREPGGYKTRILVRRPLNAERFNGTVIVEWANVSFGYDISLCDTTDLYENGYAYVLVSAQPTGLNGYAVNPSGLIKWDGERYGNLFIPDDGICYDIFTQAARAIGPERSLSEIDPMAELPVKRLIAVGASQSGMRIQSYANGVHPLEPVFDGFIPIVNAGGVADFSDELGHPDPTLGNHGHSRHLFSGIRDDLDVPVIVLNTTTEGEVLSRHPQPDTDKVRSWQIAGASHIGTKQWQQLLQKSDRDGISDSLNRYSTTQTDHVIWLPTFAAAVMQLQTWITSGRKAKTYPSLQVENGTYVCDEYGNVKGGIRLPDLEVPIARYIAGMAMPLGGYTISFSSEQLRELYPSNDSYVQKITESALRAFEEGVILKSRLDEYINMAKAAPVPKPAMPDLTPVIRK